MSPSSLPCSPSHRAGAKSADGAAGPGAGSLGGAGSSGQQHRVRQPAGRWAARQEPARYEGHAKVTGGFSCSDGRSPQPRFLRPGRKAAATASSTMNYSGVGTAPWGQAGDPFSLSWSRAGGTSTVRGHGVHTGKSWARRAVPAVPLPAGTAHAPSRGDAGGSCAASPMFTWCQPAAGTSPGSTRRWKSPGPPQHVLHPAAGIAQHGRSAEPGRTGLVWAPSPVTVQGDSPGDKKVTQKYEAQRLCPLQLWQGTWLCSPSLAPAPPEGHDPPGCRQCQPQEPAPSLAPTGSALCRGAAEQPCLCAAQVKPPTGLCHSRSSSPPALPEGQELRGLWLQWGGCWIWVPQGTAAVPGWCGGSQDTVVTITWDTSQRCGDAEGRGRGKRGCRYSIPER